ncbi:MAG TPA: hypothetical protein VGQ69_05335 [Gemmatimonadales bacterium]|jgi:hypothetical protein|nr:hypothetical protein [Gemmatimonadales bacterium]HEV8598760.1 hypothetical protein [Gemmatimonadales bacterium]
MRRTTLALALALAPGYLAAQSQPEGQTESKPASQTAATAGFSAETRVRLEAMLRVARERELPTGPLTDRIAEGQAKGASEARILAATAQVEAQLMASQEALIRAGRERPSDAEVERGAELIAHGATTAQLETLARGQSSEHRLLMAFEVLTNLAARGVPVERALEVIGGRLDVSVGAQFSGSANSGTGRSGLGAGVAGTVSGNLGVGLGRRP